MFSQDCLKSLTSRKRIKRQRKIPDKNMVQRGRKRPRKSTKKSFRVCWLFNSMIVVVAPFEYLPLLPLTTEKEMKRNSKENQGNKSKLQAKCLNCIYC